MTDVTVVGTYNPARLSTRDRIRALIADTGPDFFIPDVTIDSYIAEVTDWRYAAANAADELASIYNRRANTTAVSGEITTSYGNRAADMRALASRLRKEAALAAGQAVSFVRSVTLTRDEDEDLHSEYRSTDYVRWY